MFLKLLMNVCESVIYVGNGIVGIQPPGLLNYKHLHAGCISRLMIDSTLSVMKRKENVAIFTEVLKQKR